MPFDSSILIPVTNGTAVYKPHFDLDAVIAGHARLTNEQMLELYHHASLTDLGCWAFKFSQRLHPEDYRTYVIDRNINYTNICTARCTFCAFKRNDPEAHDAYTLSHQQIHEKIAELVSIGGTQILMQGGMNPALPIEYYLDLLQSIREKFPQVHIHAFSPPEFVEFARFFNMPVAEVLRRFKQAGQATVPGGGGEIFSDRVRSRIGPGKCTGDQWLDVMTEAHKLGMHTSVTMLIGHIETIEDRVDHLHRIRDRQDWALANAPASYTAFIHWTYQPENTPLDRKRKWDPDVGVPYEFDNGRTVRLADANEYLRMLALSRLYLDNIKNIQSSWVTMGPKVGQLALFFGANDMGSVMMEENVVSSAGTTYRLSENMICRLIRDNGWIPAQRNQYYQILQRHDGPDSPDLKPAAPGVFPQRRHKITPDQAAAYKAIELKISARKQSTAV
ncbi:MAG TPA: cyclic dehypoxanthinyl futalosine synthase [Phycisphaerae bacterium]|nr:cyclic dehypoxanthinyl futalosine synthase [Phycisphaerae bacterium]